MHWPARGFGRLKSPWIPNRSRESGARETCWVVDEEDPPIPFRPGSWPAFCQPRWRLASVNRPPHGPRMLRRQRGGKIVVASRDPICKSSDVTVHGRMLQGIVAAVHPEKNKPFRKGTGAFSLSRKSGQSPSYSPVAPKARYEPVHRPWIVGHRIDGGSPPGIRALV